MARGFQWRAVSNGARFPMARGFQSAHKKSPLRGGSCFFIGAFFSLLCCYMFRILKPLKIRRHFVVQFSLRYMPSIKHARDARTALFIAHLV